MQSNIVLWTNSNLEDPIPRQQAALDFINTVQESSPDFDFSSLAKEFANLPEVNIFDEKFPELSPPAEKFFQKIDSIKTKNPEIGMKIITILAGNTSCAFYTEKLIEVVFLRFFEWLLSEDIPRRTRLEWGLYCWENRRIVNQHFVQEKLLDPLIKLFIDESAVDAEYILRIYDNIPISRPDNSYILVPIGEDPEDFLLFARNVQHIRPQFLVDALMKLIREGDRGYEEYKVEPETLELACNELFEFSRSDNVSTELLERILVELILHSNPELSWYQQLHERLWEIEKGKNTQDDWTISYHLIATINAPRGFGLIPEIGQSYQRWLDRYNDPDWQSIKNITRHSEGMLKAINHSLSTKHPINRNKAFASPNNHQLIDATVKSFWEMTSYLKMHNLELYLYALEAAMEKPRLTVDITEEIGNRSRQLLLSEFEKYCVDNFEKASLFITYMIRRSGYTGIKIQINEVLDIIYPKLYSVNARAAESALEEGIKGENERIQLWRPKAEQSQTRAENRLKNHSSRKVYAPRPQSSREQSRSNAVENLYTAVNLLIVLNVIVIALLATLDFRLLADLDIRKVGLITMSTFLLLWGIKMILAWRFGYRVLLIVLTLTYLEPDSPRHMRLFALIQGLLSLSTGAYLFFATITDNLPPVS
jgi:hypothetical protein